MNEVQDGINEMYDYVSRCSMVYKLVLQNLSDEEKSKFMPVNNAINFLRDQIAGAEMRIGRVRKAKELAG